MNSTQDSTQHEALAMAWAMYNSRSGKASAKQVQKIMRQLSVADLTRMLAERGINTCADCGALDTLRRGPEGLDVCTGCMVAHDRKYGYPVVITGR
jgi:hypothetical protein